MKILAFFLLAMVTQVQSQHLDDYLWKNRLIILCGNTQLPKLKQQRQTLLKQKEQLEERDVILLYARSKMFEALDINNDFVGILLIGKDGGVKLKESFVVAPSVLFALIDGMPMRKAEVKKQKKKSRD